MAVAASVPGVAVQVVERYPIHRHDRTVVELDGHRGDRRIGEGAQLEGLAPDQLHRVPLVGVDPIRVAAAGRRVLDAADRNGHWCAIGRVRASERQRVSVQQLRRQFMAWPGNAVTVIRAGR